MRIKEFLKQRRDTPNWVFLAICLIWCLFGLLSDTWTIILSIPAGFILALTIENYSNK